MVAIRSGRQNGRQKWGHHASVILIIKIIQYAPIRPIGKVGNSVFGSKTKIPKTEFPTFPIIGAYLDYFGQHTDLWEKTILVWVSSWSWWRSQVLPKVVPMQRLPITAGHSHGIADLSRDPWSRSGQRSRGAGLVSLYTEHTAGLWSFHFHVNVGQWLIDETSRDVW